MTTTETPGTGERLTLLVRTQDNFEEALTRARDIGDTVAVTVAAIGCVERGDEVWAEHLRGMTVEQLYDRLVTAFQDLEVAVQEVQDDTADLGERMLDLVLP
jgi:hypothetical protein